MKISNNLPDTLGQSTAPWDDIAQDETHVIVFRDRYPCTPGHLLFVPKYNRIDCLYQAMANAYTYGAWQVEKGEWDGFNIGQNVGEVAGQTVNWPHIHLIPRRAGDVEDPVGGVRNTIPGKGNYKK